MRARALRAIGSGVLLLSFATSTLAHEFWIRPDRFAVSQGDVVAIGLRVGAGWPGEAIDFQPARIVRFAWIDAAGETPFGGIAGAEPAGRITAGRSGTAIAVYRSNDAVAELDATTFEKYLSEEGLDHVSATRASQGRSSEPARERYSRCAKSFVSVERVSRAGRGPDRTVVTQPVGLDLEIVPSVDPRLLARGGELPVRVTWKGRAAAGLLVKALAESDPALRIERRTDRDGRATLRLPAGGVWLVNAVRIEAAPEGSGFDWQSTWSSLTFEAAGTGKTRTTRR